MVNNEEDKLWDDLNRRFDTVFIGCVSILEMKMGNLWAQGIPLAEINPIEAGFRVVFDDMRKRIMDLGNSEKKKAWKILDNYLELKERGDY